MISPVEESQVDFTGGHTGRFGKSCISRFSVHIPVRSKSPLFSQKDDSAEAVKVRVVTLTLTFYMYTYSINKTES